jgi:protoheme IX farnesyltransferase
MIDRIKHYLLVTKPGILLGNAVSAAGGFFLAAKGRVDGTLLAATLLGLSLIIASACVLNNCVDKNVDRKMSRTRHRALAQELISTRAAVSYAVLLGLLGAGLLAAAAGLLCVVIAMSGFAIYVGVYSLLLKRRSAYAALVGSLAGAAPPLVGYCAAGSRFDTGALALLLIYSLWQMPHCYAIAIYRYDDYAAAGIPTIPLKIGILTAKKHLIWFTLAFAASTLTLTLSGCAGYRYLATAAVLGGVGLALAWSGLRTADDRRWARRIFAFSLLNITLLSIVMSFDFTLPARSGLFPPAFP